jgi:hypothetical protein
VSGDVTGDAPGDDPGAQPASGAAGPGPDATEQQLSEQELRAAYEAEMQRVSSAEMALQAAVSLLNIGGYRLGLAPPGPGGQGGERDLEQVRDAIDGVRGLLPILERRFPQELRQLRDALSQLQIAYAREAGNGPAADPGSDPAAGQGTPAGSETDAPTPGGSAVPQESSGPGPAESSGRLWVPGR